jgi:hypothetical protein
MKKISLITILLGLVIFKASEKQTISYLQRVQNTHEFILAEYKQKGCDIFKGAKSQTEMTIITHKKEYQSKLNEKKKLHAYLRNNPVAKEFSETVKICLGQQKTILASTPKNFNRDISNLKSVIGVLKNVGTGVSQVKNITGNLKGIKQDLEEMSGHIYAEKFNEQQTFSVYPKDLVEITSPDGMMQIADLRLPNRSLSQYLVSQTFTWFAETKVTKYGSRMLSSTCKTCIPGWDEIPAFDYGELSLVASFSPWVVFTDEQGNFKTNGLYIQDASLSAIAKQNIFSKDIYLTAPQLVEAKVYGKQAALVSFPAADSYDIEKGWNKNATISHDAQKFQDSVLGASKSIDIAIATLRTNVRFKGMGNVQFPFDVKLYGDGKIEVDKTAQYKPDNIHYLIYK